jgi:hypothetical protein
MRKEFIHKIEAENKNRTFQLCVLIPSRVYSIFSLFICQTNNGTLKLLVTPWTKIMINLVLMFKSLKVPLLAHMTADWPTVCWLRAT